jgi:DUF4097 and DUF4098 domain-containing protein YvlB
LPRDAGIQATTGSGSINISDLTGQLTLNTGSGSIDGSNVSGTLDLETSSLNTDTDQQATTGSGNIALEER